MLQRACLRASECLESAEASLGTSWMPGCTPRMQEDARGIVNALHAYAYGREEGTRHRVQCLIKRARRYAAAAAAGSVWACPEACQRLLGIRECKCKSLLKSKAYGTRCSQAVPHPSTILARRCLTSVIGRERVYSSWYGRRQSVHPISSS